MTGGPGAVNYDRLIKSSGIGPMGTFLLLLFPGGECPRHAHAKRTLIEDTQKPSGRNLLGVARPGPLESHVLGHMISLRYACRLQNAGP
jgi:hypothetical protein